MYFTYCILYISAVFVFKNSRGQYICFEEICHYNGEEHHVDSVMFMILHAIRASVLTQN